MYLFVVLFITHNPLNTPRPQTPNEGVIAGSVIVPPPPP